MVPDRLNTAANFDVLGDIFETLRFRGSVFFHSDLAAPWGISIAQTLAPRFHIVHSGSCFVGANEREAVKASETDIVMLPRGSSHWIADSPSTQRVDDESAAEACELDNPLFQNGPITNRLVCGVVQFDQGSLHPILDALPELIHFESLQKDGSIWSVVALIDEELQKQPKGSRIADRLTEVLFLHLLRNYVAKDDTSHGFIAALRDRRVYNALSLLHQHPEVDWTLVDLGSRVGMSRSTLVRRFQDIVGIAPMAYLADWRIMKAHSLIKHTSISTERIAEQTGFASARTLGRAFRRHYGCTPAALRAQGG